MAAIPLWYYLASATQALPIVAARLRGRHAPAPHRRLALLCLTFVLSDVAMIMARKLAGPNIWVAYLTQPLEVGLTLWLLSLWQPTERLRQAYAIAVPVVGCLTALLLLLTDPAVSFDQWIAPNLSLIAMAAALQTGVQRSLLARVDLTGQDWFWICSGLSLFWLSYVSVDAFATSYLRSHEDWALAAYQARTALMPVSFGLMTWGVLCSRVQESPGHS